MTLDHISRWASVITGYSFLKLVRRLLELAQSLPRRPRLTGCSGALLPPRRGELNAFQTVAATPV